MGFKAVTVNVSDLAAMGAEPLGFLLAIAIPKDLDLDSFKEIIDGVLKACDYYNIPLWFTAILGNYARLGDYFELCLR